MKDGFDRSIAERMPKMQKRRPSRPWNVDPVLIREQTDEERAEPQTPVAAAEAQPSPEAFQEVEGAKAQAAAATADARPAPAPQASVSTQVGTTSVDMVSMAVETIEDINAEFSQILFERRDIKRRLEEHDRIVEEYERENERLRENIARLERTAGEHPHLSREITFLNEQIEDADHYIRRVMTMLGTVNASYDSELAKSRALEERLERMSRDLKEKARLDVKVSILEKDLSFSTARIRELESRLEEEAMKRRPLEEEIAELKSALDKVYSSLSHIRLKAKREVYGS